VTINKSNTEKKRQPITRQTKEDKEYDQHNSNTKTGRG
jgi:hypothetical protein